MTKQIQSIVFAACCISPLLPVGAATTAQAKQCHVAVPSPAHGHWAYRFIDGRKCWYEGKNMLSKSALQWPAKAAAQPVSDRTVTKVSADKPGNTVDADACCWPALNQSDSFEARWRATLDAMGQY
jgi:hypothetical protein